MNLEHTKSVFNCNAHLFGFKIFRPRKCFTVCSRPVPGDRETRFTCVSTKKLYYARARPR